jgi:hypothetical protein
VWQSILPEGALFAKQTVVFSFRMTTTPKEHAIKPNFALNILKSPMADSNVAGLSFYYH